MSARMLTLFENDPVPEELKAAASLKARQDGIPSETTEPSVMHPDWTAAKQYYTIGEVAALFGVKTSHIRFWTNEFALKVRTTAKGDRLFTPAQIHELKRIYHLVKEQGFTIAGAKTKLKEDLAVSSIHAAGLRKSLLQLRNQLVTIRNQLK